MDLMRLYSATSELAAAWKTRLHQLNLSLHHGPSDSQTSRLQIEVKVLSFLLSRYGADPTLDYKARLRPKAQQPSLLVPECQSSKQVRSPAAIREILKRLAEANRHLPDNQALRNTNYLTL